MIERELLYGKRLCELVDIEYSVTNPRRVILYYRGFVDYWSEVFPFKPIHILPSYKFV